MTTPIKDLTQKVQYIKTVHSKAPSGVHGLLNAHIVCSEDGVHISLYTVRSSTGRLAFSRLVVDGVDVPLSYGCTSFAEVLRALKKSV
jgi:hypothetical protein